MSLMKSLVHAGRMASYRNANIAIRQSRIVGSCRWMSELAQDDKQYFDGLVKADKVVVFMKGIPEQPMCGFSNAVVQILRMHGVDDYKYHNVLDDQHIRQGIKTYSDWPTIPQVYMNGEFVGGCDILLQMHREGDLIEKLNEVGIRSALLDKDDNEVTN